jgi:hypothetical protein
MIGGALNLVAEHLRAVREDHRLSVQSATEREEQLREVCVDFATLSDEVRSRAWSFVDYRVGDPKGWRSDLYVQALQDRLEEAIVGFERTYNTLQVLGMRTFRKEAEALYEVTADAIGKAFADEPEFPDETGPANYAFLEAVNRDFYGSTSRRGEQGFPSRRESADIALTRRRVRSPRVAIEPAAITREQFEIRRRLQRMRREPNP